MSQPVGYYKKRDQYGRVVTHPITDGSGVSPYIEPDMRIIAVKHPEPPEDPMKQLLKLGIKAGEKADVAMSQRVKEYRANHSPEALLVKEQQKLALLEAQEVMAEQRAEIEIRKVEVEQRREQVKQEVKQKAIDQGVPQSS